MVKVLSVTIRNFIAPSSKSTSRTTEFDELNKYLEDGWEIRSREVVNGNNTNYFSTVYTIEK